MAAALDSKAQEEFCHRCKNIDFKNVFNLSEYTTGHGDFVASVGKITKASANTACPLCRFFSVFRSSQAERNEDEEYHLQGFSYPSANGTSWSERPRKRSDLTILNLVRGDGITSFQGQRYGETSHHIVPIPSAAISGGPDFKSCDLSLEPTFRDWHLLVSWLRICEASHRTTCSSSVPILPDMEVLDCTSGMLSNLVSGQKYFALSYVWGASKSANSRMAPEPVQHGGPFSKVVMDAMFVVRHVGGRYLWVDRHCIAEHYKDLQIRSMDKIYAGAVATIISTDPDASSGLPGIGGNYRDPQPAVKLSKELTLVSDRGHGFVESVLKTTWSTRGWTYQEAVLSRRCLFFTRRQVYFVCRAGCKSEAESKRGYLNRFPDFHDLDSKVEQSYLRPASVHNCHRNSWTFKENLEEYTRRQLTNGSEVLSAFRGILAGAPHPSYWGIPIIYVNRPGANDTDERINRYFAVGLTWETHGSYHQRDATSSRRSGFPSWSWAGWSSWNWSGYKGRFTYNHSGYIYRYLGEQDLPLTDFSIKFWLKDENLDFVPLSHLLPSFTGNESMMIPEFSPVLRIEGTFVRLRFHNHHTRIHPQISATHGFSEPTWREIRQRWRKADLLDFPNAVALDFLDEDPYLKLLARLDTEQWECLVLYGEDGPYDGWDDDSTYRGYFLLILDWRDGVAERIGSVWLLDKDYKNLTKYTKVIEIQ